MKNKEIIYLSDQVQNCFCEMFEQAFKKEKESDIGSQSVFINACNQVACCLLNNDKSYDDIIREDSLSLSRKRNT